MAIETVAVIGAGTMGHALALVHALGGCRVALHDNSAPVLARAPDLIRAALATLEEAGSLTRARGKDAFARITPVDTLQEAVASADMVVEAVVEKPKIKRLVYAEIDRHAPPGAILASNTSYLDVFPLIPDARQTRAAVAHWYTPPYIVDLVDLAPGPQTDPARNRGAARALHRLRQGAGGLRPPGAGLYRQPPSGGAEPGMPADDRRRLGDGAGHRSLDPARAGASPRGARPHEEDGLHRAGNGAQRHRRAQLSPAREHPERPRCSTG